MDDIQDSNEISDTCSENGSSVSQNFRRIIKIHDWSLKTRIWVQVALAFEADGIWVPSGKPECPQWSTVLNQFSEVIVTKLNKDEQHSWAVVDKEKLTFLKSGTDTCQGGQNFCSEVTIIQEDYEILDSKISILNTSKFVGRDDVDLRVFSLSEETHAHLRTLPVQNQIFLEWDLFRSAVMASPSFPFLPNKPIGRFYLSSSVITSKECSMCPVFTCADGVIIDLAVFMQNPSVFLVGKNFINLVEVSKIIRKVFMDQHETIKRNLLESKSVVQILWNNGLQFFPAADSAVLDEEGESMKIEENRDDINEDESLDNDGRGKGKKANGKPQRKKSQRYYERKKEKKALKLQLAKNGKTETNENLEMNEGRNLKLTEESKSEENDETNLEKDGAIPVSEDKSFDEGTVESDGPPRKRSKRYLERKQERKALFMQKRQNEIKEKEVITLEFRSTICVKIKYWLELLKLSNVFEDFINVLDGFISEFESATLVVGDDAGAENNSGATVLSPLICICSETPMGRKNPNLFRNEKISKQDRFAAKKEFLVMNRKRKKEVAKLKRWRDEFLKRQSNFDKELSQNERYGPGLKRAEVQALEAFRRKERLKEALSPTALNDILKVAVDLSFGLDFMSEKEMGKLVVQVNRLYGSNRYAVHPARVDLCCLKSDSFMSNLMKEKISGFDNMIIGKWEQEAVDVYKELGGNFDVVFLTPDSMNPLKEISSKKVYVLGGLVDESVTKNITFDKSVIHNIATARLPVPEFMAKSGVKSKNSDATNYNAVLSINQVFDILVSVFNGEEWSKAFEKHIPFRKGFVVKRTERETDGFGFKS